MNITTRTAWMRCRIALFALLGIISLPAESRAGEPGPLQGVLVLEIRVPDLTLLNAKFSDAKLAYTLKECQLCAQGVPTDKCRTNATVCQGLVGATARFWEHASLIYTEGSPGCLTLNYGGTLKTYPPGCQ